MFRAAIGKPLLQPSDKSIVGVVSDTPLDLSVPVLRFGDIAVIAGFANAHAVALDQPRR